MPLSGKQLIRLFEENGWTLDRIQGSHHIMEKPGFRPVPIPVHGNRDLQPHFIKLILKQAGLKERI
jgi:predicted RNA binding protein YcfA (HicA-like mRNA interferase family)